jgi:LysM repeat protein
MSVPAKSVQSGTHIVQRGESLGAIAAAYRISLKSLQDANGIRNANLITPGQRLRIPGSKSGVIASTKSRVASKQYVSSPPKPVKSRETVVYANVPAAGSGMGQVIEPTGPRGVTSYRVEQGDTIESVANSFASTPSEIQRINKLASPRLPAVGDEIVVPLPGSVSL